MELRFLDWLQTLRTPWLDAIMVTATNLGNGGILWIIGAAALMAHPKTRKAGVAVAISLVLELVFCNLILKPLFARPRPFEINTAVSLLISRPSDYSFPSGHTGAAFAAASALFFRKNHWWIPAGLLAAMIGFSRLYLYVHYPSDVLAGAMLGVMLGGLGSFCAGRWKRLSQDA